MEAYFNKLGSSSLPFAPWVVALIWLVIYAIMHVLFRKYRALAKAQNLIVVGSGSGATTNTSLKLMLLPLIFGAAIFAYGVFFRGPIFTFFFGGWLVTTVASFPAIVRGIFYLRAIAKPGAAHGSVRISDKLATMDQAYQIFGAAILCGLLGVLLAHLALLGGSFFLLATAAGYRRKAKKIASHEIPI